MIRHSEITGRFCSPVFSYNHTFFGIPLRILTFVIPTGIADDPGLSNPLIAGIVHVAVDPEVGLGLLDQPFQP